MMTPLNIDAHLPRRFLDRHLFLVAQVQARILAQFDDIEQEAIEFGPAEFDRQDCERSGFDPDYDETAQELTVARYGLLRDLKDQMFSGATATIFHQWDKSSRSFVEEALAGGLGREAAKKTAWAQNTNVFGILKTGGLDYESQDFARSLRACRSVVNVYKHGNGRSLTELDVLYPEFLIHPRERSAFTPDPDDQIRDFEWLTVTMAQFDKFSNAITSFWEAIVLEGLSRDKAHEAMVRARWSK